MPIQAYQIAPNPVTQDAQVAAPALDPGEGAFFAKEVNGKVEAFYANGDGDEIQLTSDGIVLGQSVFEKVIVNGNGAPIPANTIISLKESDGSMVAADSDAANGQQPVGMTINLVAFPGSGKVALFGRNMKDALDGLGFAPGKDIFLGEAPGTYTDDPQGELTGADDALVKVGVSACSDGVTNALAKDLILIRDFIAAP